MIMAADIGALAPIFKGRIEQLIESCKKRQTTIVPFFTVRDIYEQARLWRQSRSIQVIRRAIDDLCNQGAPFIAQVLEGVGPQHGRWATNALPGTSWHQYTLACDFFILEDGEAVWDASHAGYGIYEEEAKRLGLKHGADFNDFCHVQLPAREVLETTNWFTIDQIMRRQEEGGTQ